MDTVHKYPLLRGTGIDDLKTGSPQILIMPWEADIVLVWICSQVYCHSIYRIACDCFVYMCQSVTTWKL
jgi:hypothetical protein